MLLNRVGVGDRVQRVMYGVLNTKYSVLFFCVSALLAPLQIRAAEPGADPQRSAAVSPKHDVIRLFDGRTLGDCYTWLKDTHRDDPRGWRYTRLGTDRQRQYVP